MKKISIILLMILMFVLTGCDMSNIINLVSNNKTTNNTHNVDTNVSTTTKILTNKSSIVFENEFPTTSELLNLGVSVIDKKIPLNDVNHVNIVEINDTHGQLESIDNQMSISEVDSLIDYLGNNNGLEYIRICNGDLFQGSYISRMTYGECFIDTLNEANFDCMVIGNHEFDWGLEQISIYWDGNKENGEANFPLLCCNLVDSKTGKRPDFVKPYCVIEYSDVRVGIIGAIGSSLESSVDEDKIGDYYFDEINSYLKEYTSELRSYGCDVIIFSVHDYSDVYKNYSSWKSEYRIDAMIFGHTHESVDGYYTRKVDGYQIPYIQSYTKNGNIGTITINLDENNVPIDASISHYNKSYFNYHVKNSTQSIDNIVETKYRNIINSGEEVVLKIKKGEYSTKQDCASLGIEAMMDIYDCDMGFLNSGGIRTTLSNTDVKASDIFEIFPFDNHVVIAYMKGTKLVEYLNRNSGLLTNDDFDISNVDKNKTYKICTIDYLAKKSNNYMANYCVNSKFETLDDIMRDSIIDYFKNNYK